MTLTGLYSHRPQHLSGQFQARSDHQQWMSSKNCWGKSCQTYQMPHNMDTTTRTLTVGHDAGLHSPLVSVAGILVQHFLYLLTFDLPGCFHYCLCFVSLNWGYSLIPGTLDYTLYAVPSSEWTWATGNLKDTSSLLRLTNVSRRWHFTIQTVLRRCLIYDCGSSTENIRQE